MFVSRSADSFSYQKGDMTQNYCVSLISKYLTPFLLTPLLPCLLTAYERYKDCHEMYSQFLNLQNSNSDICLASFHVVYTKLYAIFLSS